MSVKDFYNAVTPGSSLTHGVGRGSYALLTDEDIHNQTIYAKEALSDVRSPTSVLNEVMFPNFL